MTADIGRNTAGDLKPAKGRSTERIDGIVAAIMAIGRAMVGPGGAPARVLAALRLTRGITSTVAIAQDPTGSLKPAKDKSTERIDGIVALIMAIGRAIVAQAEPQPLYQAFLV